MAREDFTRAEADVDVTLCNFVKVAGWHLQLQSKRETDVGRRESKVMKSALQMWS